MCFGRLCSVAVCKGGGQRGGSVVRRGRNKVGRDCDQQNSNVIVAPVAIRRGDQRLARSGEGGPGRRLGDGGKNLRNLCVVDLVRETVGGKQVDAVGLRTVALD